jgi:RNA recognition motif-containing protein
MGKKLYVGNLSYGVTSETLQQVFSAHGKVESADVIIDRMTGRGKGFGFVEMSTDAEAVAAIAATNGQDLDGRAMIVNEARPPAPRVGGGAGGGGFGGSRGGGGDRDRKGGFGGGRGGAGGGFGGGRGGAGGRR